MLSVRRTKPCSPLPNSRKFCTKDLKIAIFGHAFDLASDNRDIGPLRNITSHIYLWDCKEFDEKSISTSSVCGASGRLHSQPSASCGLTGLRRWWRCHHNNNDRYRDRNWGCWLYRSWWWNRNKRWHCYERHVRYQRHHHYQRHDDHNFRH